MRKICIEEIGIGFGDVDCWGTSVAESYSIVRGVRFAAGEEIKAMTLCKENHFSAGLINIFYPG